LNAQRPQPKEEEPRLLDRITGAIEAARAVGSGLTTGALGYVGGALGGIAGSIASGEFGTDEGLRRAKEAAEEGAAKLTYAPRTKLGQEYTRNVGEAIENTGIQGVPIGPEFQAATTLARPAARQVTNLVSNSPEAQAILSAASKVADTNILPTIDPERARLLQEASDAGITVTPDMLSNNKYAKVFGETMGKIPLSGSASETNQIAFNQRLGELIGARSNEKRLTPDVFSEAMNRSGETIGEISKKTDIPLDKSFSDQLNNLADEAHRFETSDVGKIVGNYVDELANKADLNGGVIDGETFRKINTKIGQQIRNSDSGDLKGALSNIQEVMLDALGKNISSPEELQTLLDARRKYAIGKVIEPLVAKAVDGNISPGALMGRVGATGQGKTNLAMGRAGDLGDLARIGQLIKEPSTSLTGERAAILGTLGGTAIVNPYAAGGAFGAANLYNRLSPIIARRIVKNSLPKEVPTAEFNARPELALAEESPFYRGPQSAPQTTETPYNGLLTLADEEDYRRMQQPVADTERLATTHEYPTIDFPLRQEILQEPEVVDAINGFQAEAQRLETISNNAINPKVREKAIRDLAALQAEFKIGMQQLGISNAAEASGINRPLYEIGGGTRLPIQRTFDPRQDGGDIVGNALRQIEPYIQQIDQQSKSQNPALQAEIERIRQMQSNPGGQ
jgi:hypothetical protein